MNGYSVEALARLLSYLPNTAEATESASYLIEKYGSLGGVLSLDINVLRAEPCLGAAGAAMLKLVSDFTARSHTEQYKFGVSHTSSETDAFLKAKMRGLSAERVYLLSFDKAGRAIECDLVTEGTVNASEILPRKVIECAIRRGAHSVIVAHNHPRGVAKPSEEDVRVTAMLAQIFNESGIRLVRHCIVSGNEIYSIGTDGSCIL